MTAINLAIFIKAGTKSAQEALDACHESAGSQIESMSEHEYSVSLGDGSILLIDLHKNTVETGETKWKKKLQ